MEVSEAVSRVAAFGQVPGTGRLAREWLTDPAMEKLRPSSRGRAVHVCGHGERGKAHTPQGAMVNMHRRACMEVGFSLVLFVCMLAFFFRWTCVGFERSVLNVWFTSPMASITGVLLIFLACARVKAECISLHVGAAKV